MGTACSVVDQLKDSEELTDETWSNQLRRYLEIEDSDVEAELIYHFDGKAVSGRYHDES